MLLHLLLLLLLLGQQSCHDFSELCEALLKPALTVAATSRTLCARSGDLCSSVLFGASESRGSNSGSCSSLGGGRCIGLRTG
jgi:hypothetical protein